MSKKPVLVVMAAGIGSRFGKGIKQLAAVGPSGEIIMDYSLFDAREAGFEKVIFIIRHALEKDFKEIIGKRVEKYFEVAYAYQEITDLPEGFVCPEDRSKPWGTGHAILAARELIDGPFAVINADDYYGKTAFHILHDWLNQPHSPTEYSLAGFILKNTLSEHGGVTRGICSVNADGYLTDVCETKNILKTPEGASVDGFPVDAESHVSMNMWGLMPEFIPLLEEGFEAFFTEAVPQNPLKAEYLLPIYIGQLLREGRVSVKVLETRDAWFGVTYKEDKPAVVASFKNLLASGVYSEDLYSDL